MRPEQKPLLRFGALGLVIFSLLGTVVAQEHYRVAVADVTVTVGEEGKRGNTDQLQYPNPLPETLLLQPGSAVTVGLTLTDESSQQAVAPQQVMVRATSAASGQQAFFLARSVPESGTGARAATITPAALAKQLGSVGGRFSLALLVGDVAVANPILWDLAQVPWPTLRTAR